MTPTAILEAIQRHRAFSHNKVEALRREIASIEKDAEELAIAERVVRRLTAESDSQPGSSALPETKSQYDAPEPESEDALNIQASPASNGEPEYTYGH